MRSSKPITVTLDQHQTSGIDRRLASGLYESASEVIEAGLRALDREEEALGQIMGDIVRAAFASDGPDIAVEDVFARLRAHHANVLLAPIDCGVMPWALIDQTGESPFMPDGREWPPVLNDR